MVKLTEIKFSFEWMWQSRGIQCEAEFFLNETFWARVNVNGIESDKKEMSECMFVFWQERVICPPINKSNEIYYFSISFCGMSMGNFGVRNVTGVEMNAMFSETPTTSRKRKLMPFSNCNVFPSDFNEIECFFFFEISELIPRIQCLPKYTAQQNKIIKKFLRSQCVMSMNQYDHCMNRPKTDWNFLKKNCFFRFFVIFFNIKHFFHFFFQFYSIPRVQLH